MKYFSTFSGIGGFELGIEQAYETFTGTGTLRETVSQEGEDSRCVKSKQPEQSSECWNHTCIGFSEIDKYAAEIYQRHFPNHKNYGDITTINEKELPDFDLLVGGFPCQAFSIAGKRGGFEDTRGTMFFELARILREKQPRLFMFENVKGLLSHDKGNTFRAIITTLDELGYDCQWQLLNSKNHGVPQNRERVFIVGHLRGTSGPKVFPFAETDGSDIQSTEAQTVNCVDANYYKGIDNHGQRTAVRVGTLRTHKDGEGFREKKDGLCPTIPARAREDGSGQPVISIPEATKQGYAVAHEGDSINLSVPNSKTRRGRVGKKVAQTLDTGMQQYTLQNSKIRRLTPTECERLQGFPDGWTQHGAGGEISDTQRYKTLGNAVTVNVIADIMEKLLVDN